MRPGISVRVAFVTLVVACAMESWDSPRGDGWRALAVGGNLTCGVDAEGVTSCWGYKSDGVQVPEEELSSLSIGDQICGLTPQGEAVCGGVPWADDVALSQMMPGPYVDIAAGNSFACVIVEASGAVDCAGILDAPDDDGAFVDIAADHTSACGIRTDGSMSCWGREPVEILDGTDFVRLDLHTPHVCGVTSAGEIRCSERFAHPGSEGFVDVSIFPSGGCALKETGEIQCWAGGQSVEAPAGHDFVAVAADSLQLCGLTSAGRIECVRQPWGNYGCY